MASGNARGSAAVVRVPQRQRGRDRVAGLLQAAAALFVEKGYDATTMTEIAASAGASIGGLYLFFATKAALAQAMATGLADALTVRLDRLGIEMADRPAAAIADALFDALSEFLAVHPVYGTLLDLPGDDAWKIAVRARRRAQIAALFEGAAPALPPGQSERLAVIVPHLMRMTIALTNETPRLRAAVLADLRAMLRDHLA